VVLCLRVYISKPLNEGNDMKNDSTDKTFQPEHSVITEEESVVTPELSRRAQAIIDDLNQPEQTRKAVDYAVKFGWRTADVVRRAEAGEDLSWCKTEKIERQMDEWRELRYGKGFLPLGMRGSRRSPMTDPRGLRREILRLACAVVA
jgi:hypothetical protein